ncbi:MAG: glyoxalase/bleomycin resistance/dioxygenase family protein [Bacteroidota bacterium]|nr:glyoxalase/bleomycin resistance/dioxygenase family protein [Bacteroidota bacterium]
MKDFIAHIGGVFIYSENAKTLAEWYTNCFGIAFEYTEDYQAYFASYPYPDTNDKKKFYTAFSILQSNRRPKLDFNAFCLNLRVNNIEELVQHLRLKDVTVKDIEEYSEGKFTHIIDIENNLIELWEDTTSL